MSATKTNRKFKDYFYKEKTVLRAFGVSLNDNESAAYKMYAFIVIFSLNFMYTVVDIREVFINDFDVVAGMIMYPFGIAIAIFKTCVVLLSRSKLAKILDKLEREPFLPNWDRGGEEEDKVMKFCLWITTIQTYVYWGCAAVCLTFAALFTLIIRIRSSDFRDWEFPYGPLHILNATHSPNFEIAWVYQNISLVWIGVHFTTIDLIMAAVFAHISFQFKILQNNFKRIVENSYNKMIKNDDQFSYTPIANTRLNASTIPWKYLHQSLTEAIDYHLAIIDIAEEMEKVFSNLLLLVFLGTLGMLCFDVYHASLVPVKDSKMIRSSIEVVTGCVQVLTICFWGNEVMLESQKVGQAVWEANFVGTDLKFQKSLVLVIRRSQNPTKITAGKFADISLFTFTWILKTSYSAFMVLKSQKTDVEDA